VGNTTLIIPANIVNIPTACTFFYKNGRSGIKIAAKIQLFFDSVCIKENVYFSTHSLL